MREFGIIQKGRRVALSKEMLEYLGWSVGDQVILEEYKGKIVVEPLSKVVRPLEERVR